VYNLLGQTVKTVEPISRAYTLDFRQLTPGNYIVIVTLDDNTVFVQKIIKQ
jgi:hypothetical protein